MEDEAKNPLEWWRVHEIHVFLWLVCSLTNLKDYWLLTRGGESF
jgi:hypothetical protein